MSQPRIFVSHSHNDNAYCREFVAALRTHLGSNEAVWYDEHNLGWGKIRREIERELAQRQHFIAILSPTAVESDWVNDEIDAAIELRRRGSIQTIQFVVALKCEMPLLLSNYKRVVAPDGQSLPAEEAARRALAVIQPTPPAITPETPQSTAPQAAKLSPLELNELQFQQHAEYRRQEQLQTPPIPPDRFPKRLADLGFMAHSDKGIEYILPPLCTVSAGSFLMGSDLNRDPVAAKEGWTYNEEPQHTVTLPAFEIARFPVTVAEYACFVRAGHAEPEKWKSQLGKDDHPVVNVIWHDAVTYAAWLSERTGERWRLPTEAEWEKAARGADGRIYPWGDSFDQARCNTSESGIGTTTRVWSYPTGAGPYGTQDMTGNASEWTSSRDHPYPYTTSGEHEDANSITSRVPRVLRGGSWNSDAGHSRAAYRSPVYSRPDYWADFIGFRLVQAALNS